MNTKSKKAKTEMECNLDSKGKQMTFSKDSFERFGDDLTELLLSYLPLKEKFRFECISKQWKAFVFNKQFVLNIIELKNGIKFLDINKDKRHYSFDERVLKIVFKKCSFIKKLKVRVEEKIIDIIEEKIGYEETEFLLAFYDSGIIFELITKYCRYLEIFKYYIHCNQCNSGFDFNDKFTAFSDKCGHKLKYVYIECDKVDDNMTKNLYSKTPNIRKVVFNEMVFIHSNDGNILRNLNAVMFYVFNDEFQVFTDVYHKQIETFSGIIGTDIYSLTLGKINTVPDVLQQISRFEKLKILNIYELQFWGNIHAIDAGLVMIANNCKLLEKLCLCLSSPSEVLQIKGEVFQIVSKYKSLKCLSIKFGKGFNHKDINFGELKNLSKITNLSKLTLEWIALKDEVFEDIHLYLPNLTTISFSRMNGLTDEILKHLSKVANLSSLKLNYIGVTFDGIQKLIEKCLKLKYIEIIPIKIPDEFPLINSIAHSIDFAVKRPQIMHRFGFNKMVFQKVGGYEECERKLKTTQLPKNLIIEWT